MRKLFLLAAGVVLAGCQSGPPISAAGSPAPLAAPPPPASTYAPYNMTAADRTAVEEGVRRNLKDPNSAMFGSMSAAKDSNGAGLVEVCGYVNAKNSFGGFTGNAIFYGALADTKTGGKAFIPIGSISTSEDDMSVKQTVCSKAGIYL